MTALEAPIERQISGRGNEATIGMETTRGGRPKSWVHFLAGGVGGMCGAIVTSPLDVVKTRLQSDMYGRSPITQKPSGIRKKGMSAALQHARRLAYTFVETGMLLKRISAQEGPKALFRGLGPTLVGVIPARSINFFTYGNGKVIIADAFNGGAESPTVHLVAAAWAGIVTATMTNPIWVVKTRMQLLQHKDHKLNLTQSIQPGVRANASGKARLSTSASASARSFGMFGAPQTFFRSKPRPLRPEMSSIQMTVNIARTEGVAGLYKGLSASYLGATEGTIQWVLYEQFKRYEHRRRIARRPDEADSSMKSSWFGTIGSAGTAKVIASLITYPHEVLRTRLRQERLPGQARRYVGLLQTASLILREEGVSSFYGGLSAHLLRVVPNAAIMFLVYETMLSKYRSE